MKCTLEKNGLTLLEIIISVAMLGILVISFSAFFSTGFGWVTKAGDTSQAIYASQKFIEKAIVDESGVSSEVFHFDFGITSFDVPGKIETSTGEVALQVFVPIISAGGGTPPNTDLETIQNALDSISSLSVISPGNNNTDSPKPTITLPSPMSGVTFTFTAVTAVPNAVIVIPSGQVTRDNVNRTGTITLRGQLNGNTIEKVFNVSIPRNRNNNSGDVLVVAQ